MPAFGHAPASMAAEMLPRHVAKHEIRFAAAQYGNRHDRY